MPSYQREKDICTGSGHLNPELASAEFSVRELGWDRIDTFRAVARLMDAAVKDSTPIDLSIVNNYRDQLQDRLYAIDSGTAVALASSLANYSSFFLNQVPFPSTTKDLQGLFTYILMASQTNEIADVDRQMDYRNLVSFAIRTFENEFRSSSLEKIVRCSAACLSYYSQNESNYWLARLELNYDQLDQAREKLEGILTAQNQNHESSDPANLFIEAKLELLKVNVRALEIDHDKGIASNAYFDAAESDAFSLIKACKSPGNLPESIGNSQINNICDQTFYYLAKLYHNVGKGKLAQGILSAAERLMQRSDKLGKDARDLQNSFDDQKS